MTKLEFLKQLEAKLCGLPQEDIQKSLDFYSEMIDDRIEDGISVEDAILQIGTPEEIAKQTLIDTPITKLVKQKFNPRRSMGAGEILLLVLGAPLWLPLIVAAIAIVLSVYIVLWSVIISLYAVDFSLAVSGLAGVLAFGIFKYTGATAQGLFIAGCGLVCVGLAIILFFVFNQITKGLLCLSKKIWLVVKSCFIKRGVSYENC